MSLDKRVVHAWHVVGPFAISMLATIVLLICWTVIDPFEWQREVIDVDTGETYGECASDNPLYFSISVLLLMILSTVACGSMAFKCRNIDARFSEANWIFYTFFVQSQALLVGIPILIILNTSSVDATYFGRSLLIFVIVLSTLVLMIGSKLLALWHLMITPTPTLQNDGPPFRISSFSSIRFAGPTRGQSLRTAGSGGGTTHVSGIAALSVPREVIMHPTKSAGKNRLTLDSTDDEDLTLSSVFGNSQNRNLHASDDGLGQFLQPVHENWKGNETNDVSLN